MGLQFSGFNCLNLLSDQPIEKCNAVEIVQSLAHIACAVRARTIEIPKHARIGQRSSPLLKVESNMAEFSQQDYA